MKKHEYLDQELNSTCFTLTENGVRLDSLFGLNLGSSGNEAEPARAAGLLSLSAGSTNYNSDQLILQESLFTEDSASITWQTGNNELLLQSDWRYSRKTDIWLRSDILTNESKKDVIIRRCLARFTLSPGSYEVYSQGSRWCGENQGGWQVLERGGVVLRSEGGRTTQGGTPFVCIRDSDSKEALIFHIIPKGNWIIKVTAGTAEGDSPSYAVLELGMADTHLFYSLAPGRSIELPQILIQKAPKGEPHLAAPNLHVYLLENIFAANEESVPIVYNTWFDDFEFLAVPRLRRQLKAAKEIGCEVFVVDAGWYGGAAGSWSEQTGDWREKEDAAFEGRMADFAEEVRSEGLGFGLWMEPERLCKSVPIRIEHPEWFLAGSGGHFYPDLSREEVSGYIFSEMSRLIEIYNLAWMKVDFNFEFGPDPKGSEFYLYYDGWYGILDKLKLRYPHVLLEGCASGGLRMDVNTAAHFGTHFLSDNVNPWDALRIHQGALLRMSPGRIARWTCLRSVGNHVPRYGTPFDQSAVTFITPSGSGATWDSSETADLDFAVRASLPGVFGLSGDIAGLPREAIVRLRNHVDFSKKWRQFIAGSVAHLLTRPKPKGDRSGWIGIQLSNPNQNESLVFAYRLDDPDNRRSFRLRGLNRELVYRAEYADAGVGTGSVSESGASSKSESAGVSSGNGILTVALLARNTAAVFVISTQ